MHIHVCFLIGLELGGQTTARAVSFAQESLAQQVSAGSWQTPNDLALPGCSGDLLSRLRNGGLIWVLLWLVIGAYRGY